MSTITGNMGLVAWNSSTDYFSHAQLAANMQTIDDHDHSPGKGRQISHGGLAGLSVGAEELRDDAVLTAKILDESVTAAKIGPLAVITAKLDDGAVTTDKFHTLPHARVYNSIDIPVTQNTDQALTFDLESFDNPGGLDQHVGTTAQLIARVAGLYSIAGTIEFAASSSGTQRALAIRLNGTTIIGGWQKCGPLTSPATTGLSVSAHWRMVEGDYVELIARQDTSGSLNVKATTNYSPTFSFAWLSP